MKLVLAAGASDASEGLVGMGRGKACSCLEAAVEEEGHLSLEAEGGFWSIAPGCSDAAEGLVWVPASCRGTGTF